eukprot:TRINITY_DN93268_c0_g1_i1.p1 TRINITY_DN93268_c0_g1~~TRINITY_DN93268_c0_g1_i1.p1  ORF type:complete len:639 (+),score=148.02 TRINITY_DN93268_c0_g1_i1:92-2008(+)
MPTRGLKRPLEVGADADVFAEQDEFVAFGGDGSDDESDEAEVSPETTQLEGLASAAHAEESALDFDLKVTDLLLEVDGVTGTTFQSPSLQKALPEAWMLARGASAVRSGSAKWRLRVSQLDDCLTPSVIAGWISQPAGATEMPSFTGLGHTWQVGGSSSSGHSGSDSSQQPHIIAATDDGKQVFTSNLSGALLGARLASAKALEKGFLRPGSVLECSLLVEQAAASFKVEGSSSETFEARRLATLPGSCTSQRLQETRFFPFFAVRGSAKVQALRLEGAGENPLAVPALAPQPANVNLLVGPPGSGKTAWAVEHASKAAPGHPVHIAGAEWLRHRATLLDDALRDLDAGSAGRRPLRPPELHVLLGGDAICQEDDYWEPVRRCWDFEGIRSDLEITRRKAWQARGCLLTDAARPTSATSKAPTDDTEGLRSKAFAAASGAAMVRWPLRRARVALHTVMPDLLQRAALRGDVQVVADDSHLDVRGRAALLSAATGAAEAAGDAPVPVVRWTVIVPKTVEELRARRRKTEPWTLADDLRSGATLPLLPGSRGSGAGGHEAGAADVVAELASGEFAASPSQAAAVFNAWRRARASDLLGVAASKETDKDVDAATTVQAFDEAVKALQGGAGVLSTEGGSWR